MKTGLLFIFLISAGNFLTTDEVVNVSYQFSNEDIPNPERGFYRYSHTHSSNYIPLSEATLKGYRDPQYGTNGKYQVKSTLVFRYFVLDNFRDTVLNSDILDKIQKDFQTARNAGVKLIPRFTYSITPTSGKCPAGFVCPPYGDATKAIILKHIAQLKPIFIENADVIAYLQMGFIGMWGENYYTDFFGDASVNAKQGKLFDNNWQDRIDVLKALLNAVPEHIMIQVRYPQMKQRYIYGINAPITSAALTDKEAFTGKEKARIGFHNDCLFASEDDFGTYNDYGNSSTPIMPAIAPVRKYLSEDSRYVVVGGETCYDGYSPQNDCEPIGKALSEFKAMHYTYLNADYNNEVNDDWETGGCMEEIKRKLGYRILLKQGTYPKSIERMKNFTIQLELENIGYASPTKDRPVELLLREKTNGAIHKFRFETDIRKWYNGPIELKGVFQINKDFPKGEYELLLNLPDKAEQLKNRSEYSIQLANENVWERNTGFNKLNYTLRIN